MTGFIQLAERLRSFLSRHTGKGRASLSRQLAVGLAILVTVQSLIVGISFYRNAVSMQYAVVERFTRSVLADNAQLIDVKLARIQEQADKLAVNTGVFGVVVATNDGAAQEVNLQYVLNTALYQCFSEFSEIIDINLVSDRFSYSYAKLTQYSYISLRMSDMFNEQMTGGRFLRWIPTAPVASHTYPLLSIAQREKLMKRPVVRFLKQLNMAIYVNGNIVVLPSGISRPLLLIDIDPALFDNHLSANLPTENSLYVVASPDGDKTHIVATNHSGWVGTVQALPFEPDAQGYSNDSASVKFGIDGTDYLVFAACSTVNDWVMSILVPVRDIEQSSRQSLLLILIVMAATLIPISLLMFMWIVRTMQPVSLIVQQVESIEQSVTGKEGGFSVSGVHLSDVSMISHSIGAMNKRIDRLMRENKELAMREREATILSLEMQINPHFLYNSLNKIYMQLYNTGQRKLAEGIISLSSVLRYSIDSKAHVVFLSDDLKQLHQYIAASKLDQDVMFSVYIDIDPTMLVSIVPKMLLQPFVENAIVHAFKTRKHSGIIHIHGSIVETGAGRVSLFIVEDNGEGIPAEKIPELTEGSEGHIGCANVHLRIQLLYGNQYGVSVSSQVGLTHVEIRLPYITETTPDASSAPM